VTPRHIALGLGSLVVLATGLYLFVEVRSAPAQPPMSHVMSGKLETSMTEANKAYDRGDLDEARQLAQKILMRQPGNERMLRIMVSSSCMDGDAADAQKYYNQLPPHDRSAMKTRCERYGITFTDPPTQ
jgi:predicted Zn-dependent protease